MGVIEAVHEELEADVPLEEFRAAVEEKVAEMGDLADTETAATLVAYELDDDRVVSIDEIDAELAEVKFLGKVRRVGDLREFEREDADQPGQVINVELVDETGRVRVAFWDEQATAIDREAVEPDTVMRVRGRPRDGQRGLEVSAQDAEVDEEAEIAVDVTGPDQIGSLAAGDSAAQIRGRVLETEEVRSFDRDDGSTGQVSNVVIGDETGSIRITLWDDAAERATDLSEGDVIELDSGSVRDRDGHLEYHVGTGGSVSTTDADVTFVPEVTPLGELAPGETADIAGVVRSTDGVRTFDRDDGSTGQVRNLRLQDQSGDIRVAIWGERAERDLGPGDPVWFGDVEIDEGWQDELEASVNWQSALARIDRSALAEVTSAAASGTDTSQSDAGSGGTDLGAFADEVEEAPTEEAVPDEFTGTVVQTGNPVILDDGSETVRVDTRESVTLGEELTVTGPRTEDRIDAEEIARADGKH